jgi:hypothetical protein
MGYLSNSAVILFAFSPLIFLHVLGFILWFYVENFKRMCHGITSGFSTL